jgi:hypothetical protein
MPTAFDEVASRDARGSGRARAKQEGIAAWIRLKGHGQREDGIDRHLPSAPCVGVTVGVKTSFLQGTRIQKLEWETGVDIPGTKGHIERHEPTAMAGSVDQTGCGASPRKSR